MSILSLIKDLCDELGLPRPSAVVGATGDTERQLIALAKTEGRELSVRYAWECLTQEATFTTTATESQGAIDSIITNVSATQVMRYIINDTIWNRTQQRPVLGPRAPRDWQALKASNVTGPYSEYRIRGGLLYFMPVPAAGETCAFEYVSRCWVVNAAGTAYAETFALDTDEVLLDNDLFYAGLKWRWLQRKGFEYGEAFASYERMVADAMARDGTKPTLNLGESRGTAPGGVIVPEGNWTL